MNPVSQSSSPLRARFSHFGKSIFSKRHFWKRSNLFWVWDTMFPASKQTNLFHLISSSVLPFFGFPVRPSAKILDSHRSFHRRFPSLREGGRHSRGTRPEMDKSIESCILETLAATPAGVGTDAATASCRGEPTQVVGPCLYARCDRGDDRCLPDRAPAAISSAPRSHVRLSASPKSARPSALAHANDASVETTVVDVYRSTANVRAKKTPPNSSTSATRRRRRRGEPPWESAILAAGAIPLRCPPHLDGDGRSSSYVIAGETKLCGALCNGVDVLCLDG